MSLVENQVDILIANEAEITSLYEARDFDEALQQVRRHVEVAMLTRGEKGCVIVSGDEIHIVDAESVDKVVDTTGAGDLAAAGFLHGFTRGFDLHTCGRIAGITAAEIISHYGARPETSLSALVNERLK